MTVQETLNDREAVYGDYQTTAICSQSIKGYMRQSYKWPGMRLVLNESLDMIAVKLARILTGDPNHVDTWHDIAGYAQLAADYIEKMENEEKADGAVEETQPG